MYQVWRPTPHVVQGQNPGQTPISQTQRNLESAPGFARNQKLPRRADYNFRMANPPASSAGGAFVTIKGAILRRKVRWKTLAFIYDYTLSRPAPLT
jgi:hypothetical protein